MYYALISPPYRYSSNKAFISWQLTHGRAFVFARTDWEYVFNTFAFGYAIGYHFLASKEGSCNGNFLGIGKLYWFENVVCKCTSPQHFQRELEQLPQPTLGVLLSCTGKLNPFYAGLSITGLTFFLNLFSVFAAIILIRGIYCLSEEDCNSDGSWNARVWYLCEVLTRVTAC